MTNYANEFNGAIARTKKFDLKIPKYSIDLARRWLTSNSPKEIHDWFFTEFDTHSPVDLVPNRIELTRKMSMDPPSWLGCDVVYTIGWIDDRTPTGRFKFGDAEIENWLLNGGHIGRANLHVWLTLPSMEIVDLFLPSIFAVTENKPEISGGVIAGHADDVTRVAYKPMLIGDDFLKRSGILYSE